MFSIAEVHTKVINYNSAKSCLLQVVHIKAIAALTQFCNFYMMIYSGILKRFSLLRYLSLQYEKMLLFNALYYNLDYIYIIFKVVAAKFISYKSLKMIFDKKQSLRLSLLLQKKQNGIIFNILFYVIFSLSFKLTYLTFA